MAGHSLVNLIKVESPPLLPIGLIDAAVPFDWLVGRLGLNLPGYSLGAYLMESSEKISPKSYPLQTSLEIVSETN